MKSLVKEGISSFIKETNDGLLRCLEHREPEVEKPHADRMASVFSSGENSDLSTVTG
jgi:hypothetical protein